MSTTTALFANDYATAFPELSVRFSPQASPSPEQVIVNRALAGSLGLGEWVDSPEGREVLAGNAVPTGAEPVAMAYAGHQFGGYSPLLGDGRAVLVGELIVNGEMVDVHLKGSGRTPFSRGGDGKATLRAMLREYVLAEGMHALGVRTSRALAVVRTGDAVIRDTMESGAVLTRIASSHLRVGTFEYAARRSEPDLLRRLADYAIARHYPAIDGDDRYLRFLEAVVDAQARLVSSWMVNGFIHGVMNTDNTLISGETIDYGPCAFLENYDPGAVFSSIDHGGRYAYGNQPGIVVWNLSRLAETLLALIDPVLDTAVEKATAVLRGFEAGYRQYWIAAMAAKLGLAELLTADPAAAGTVGSLADDLLAAMGRRGADYTGTFRALATSLRGERTGIDQLLGDELGDWEPRWLTLLGEMVDPAAAATAMDRVNPLYIPRNHLVEEALDAANDDDLEPVETLLDVLTDPFTERPGLERYAAPAPPGFTDRYRTFCGT